MILGIGTDVFEVARISRELQEADQGLIPQVFHPSEISYCNSQHFPARHYAARFAGKEAVIKALSDGGEPGLYLHDVEILRDPTGQPFVKLHGRLRIIAERLTAARIHLSLSHTPDVATAFVIIES
jgi:holo-[acyl-carrier protein] synthase